MSGNWPGTAGLPAVPSRAAWTRKSIQLPLAADNGETAAPEVIWGTVTPNGAVTGKPGDTYFQTSVTNTATLWQKFIGVGTTTGWFRMQAEVGLYNPATYGVDLAGVVDGTTAMQQCLSDAVAAGGVMTLGPGAYKCGLITDATASRLQIVAMPGAVIHPTGPTWLKVIPGAQAKFGVRLDGLVFSPGNMTDGAPIIWLEGSSSGGIVEIDIHDIDFGTLTGLHGDLLWLRACFNGAVGRLWCHGGGGCRGVLYTARNFNSGNIRFHDFNLSDIGVALQLGQAFNATTNQNLLNQIPCQNMKFQRSAESAGMFTEVTLTAGVNAGDTTLTVSGGDATNVANGLAAGTPMFAILADPTYTGDVVRVTAASGTTITLALASPTALANTSIILIGSFGAVVGANTRGVRFDTPHVESTGAGIVVTQGQSVQIENAICPATVTNPSRLVVQINGAQNVKTRDPIYSAAATQLTISEIVVQGTVTDCDLVEPTAFSSGAGPANFLLFTGVQVVSNRNRFLRRANGGATQALTYGATTSVPDESFDLFVLTVTDGNAFTIPNPTNRWSGRRLLFDIYNNSGGAMGAVTFGTLYKLAGAFAAPANGLHRLYEFEDSFLGGSIREITRSAADVGN